MSAHNVLVSERLSGDERPGDVQWSACQTHPFCARLTIIALPEDGKDSLNYPSITAHIGRGDVRNVIPGVVGAFIENALDYSTRKVS